MFKNVISMTRNITNSRRLTLSIAILLLASLACFSYDYLVVFDPAGNGDGTIEGTFSYPSEIFSESNSVSTAIEDLEKDGWEAVSMHQDGDKYVFSGLYHFSTDPSGHTLRDIFPDLGIKIEESENEYRYFTVEGKLDLTELASFWDEIENVWAKEGLVSPNDNLVYDKGEVIFRAEEVQELIDKYGPPRTSVRIMMPGQTPVEANAAWENREDFMAGKTQIVEFLWTPDVRDVTPVKVVSRIEPITYVTEAEANAQIAEIIRRYMQEIKPGTIPSDTRFSGTLNNWLIAWYTNNHTCSDYQGQVIFFLDQIRTNPDPEIRKLLEGLDYGPIDTNYQGHLAVVLYQRGTDWTKTGTVLDPWPAQKPQAFPITDWQQYIWGYDTSTPNPDHESGQFYPHLSGGTPSYPASSDSKGDLSVEKKLAKPSVVLYIGSPVTPLLTLADGQQVGVLPNGSFVNQLGSGVNVYSLPKTNGSGYEWLFLLPAEAFGVTLSGTQDGTFQTLIGTEEGVFEYGSQPISAGGGAWLTVSAGLEPGSLILEDGTEVTASPVSAGDDVEVVEAAPTEPADDQPIYSAGGDRTMVVILLACCCMGAVGIAVGIVIVLVLRRNKQKSQTAQMP